ncbi:hypothetical protein CTP10_R65430 (plasmid) [Cupriavidus sp. P-10]|uniref:hypothetical protein n=1 Tax=Cupriavidus sp. P-10 TaxID=2027911 RepID=UPI000EED69F4|nr:hypothetical protein [Cupriavidus sp. P-10]BDB29130.1 hypothetical protein CTP10_R65430 [Cupriavidus sp. P-10]
MEAANAFMAEFIAYYNARFAKVPRNNHNAHRPLRSDRSLDLIFASAGANHLPLRSAAG